MAMMSTARLAAQEMRSPFKEAFHPQDQGGLQDCWNGHGDHRLENTFFSLDPMPCGLNSPDQPPSVPTVWGSSPADGPGQEENGHQVLPLKASLPSKGSGADPDEGLLPGFSRLSLGTSSLSEEAPPHTPVRKSGPGSLFCPPGDRSARPLPPLPAPRDLLHDDMDREVEEFLTTSDTACLLDNGGEKGTAFDTSAQGGHSFRGCGEINLAYVDNPRGPKGEEEEEEEAPSGSPQLATCPPPPPPPPQQLHRRLRRSHSGPAGSFHKPVVRVTGHFRQASPSSDDDRKPEVPPRAPIPPRAPKPDYRRWSAEVASSAYSDEDRPPKVPPREPLSRGGSRTPSPKSLPSYLYGIMPPTQSFAPDPKYVSSKALQRQHSEGAPHCAPCILPIIENGRKVSSTHYYLLPERPPYLDRYEKFFLEAEEATAGADGQLLWGEGAHEAVAVTATLAAPLKRKHLPCAVSP